MVRIALQALPVTTVRIQPPCGGELMVGLLPWATIAETSPSILTARIALQALRVTTARIHTNGGGIRRAIIAENSLELMPFHNLAQLQMTAELNRLGLVAS